MRSLLFNIFFWIITALYAIVCVILSLLPGRKIMMGSLRRYTRLMIWGMRVIAGIKVQVTGHEHIPQTAPLLSPPSIKAMATVLWCFRNFLICHL